MDHQKFGARVLSVRGKGPECVMYAQSKMISCISDFVSLFFSSPEQKLRVSYCHHPMSVVRRTSSVVRRQQLVC